MGDRKEQQKKVLVDHNIPHSVCVVCALLGPSPAGQ